jgi:uncharacterized protein (DUF2236 family)
MKQYMGWRVDFAQPPGEPAYAAPGSITWQVFANPVAMAVGGICAVLLEFADPRVRSGVWDHSTFPTDPVGRGRRTGMAAHIGVFGPRSAAQKVIAGVTKMHAGVAGMTPDGTAYRALDQALLDWVAATATYGFVMAYHRFVRPLADDDIDRFFTEALPVGRLYGARHLPRGLGEFERMCEARLDTFEAHPFNLVFLDIIRSGTAVRAVPRWLQRELAHASIAILPPRVRSVLQLGDEFDLSPRGAMAIRMMGRLAAVVPQPGSPPARASERLGLPRSFPWRSRAAQQRLLRRRRMTLGAASD